MMPEPQPTVDLHIHSTHRDDGDFSPEQLFSMAQEAGLDFIAIADHNTTSAVAAAKAAGGAAGIAVLSGVELDCHYYTTPLHILGYNVEHADARFRHLADDLLGQERAAAAERISLVRGLGVVVDHDEVMAKSRDGVVTAELLAETALADPANRDNPLLVPYRPGGARADNPYVNFYWDHCSAGKPAHVAIRHMTLDEALRLIADTGGVPVVAHPGVNLKGREELIRELAAAGVRGVEAFSSYHTPETCLDWKRRADALGLFVTAGSDFHGKTKPSVRLGGHGGGRFEAGILAGLAAAGLKRG